MVQKEKGKAHTSTESPASRATVPGLSDPVTRVEGKNTACGQSTSRATQAGKLFFFIDTDEAQLVSWKCEGTCREQVMWK